MNELLLSKPKITANLLSYRLTTAAVNRVVAILSLFSQSILIENGVTVFRSQVVGYEELLLGTCKHQPYHTEMAGAIGDKVYNCRDAFQNVLMSVVIYVW